MSDRCPALPQEALRARDKARRAELDRARDLAPKVAIPPQSVFDMHAKARKARLKASTLRAANPTPTRKVQQLIKGHEDEARRCDLEAKRLMDEASDGSWVHAANDETVALAQARGEVVERGKAGIRILTRGGVEHALGAGYLTPADGVRLTAADLHGTARAYRDCYEITSGLTSPNRESAGAAKGDGWQASVVQAGERLATMRRGLSKLEIEVLDRVCGQDMRAREAATVLRRRFQGVRDALRDGLQSATINVRAARAARSERERYAQPQASALAG